MLFRSFGGTFDYDATNETLTTLNFVETLLMCEEETIENEYFSFFRDEMPLRYYIGHDWNYNKTLILEHPTLDYKLFFQGIPLLATPDFLVSDIILYPNPVSDQLFISSENTIIENITVYSLTGKIVLDLENETNSIDVSALTNGVYIIELSTAKGKSINKFVKN